MGTTLAAQKIKDATLRSGAAREGQIMSYAIVWASKGGNTAKVGEELARSLAAAGAELAYAGALPSAGAPEEAQVLAADTVLAGSWTDKGDCDPALAELLAKLDGKRVFLFGTAGFGGDPAYFERILGNFKKHLPAGAELLGGAMCQGKMGAGIRHRYEAMLAENPEDARAQAMIANFDAALAHPTDDDLAQIVTAAREALGL